MKIDVLRSTGCAICLRELDSLRAAARQACPDVEWNELDTLKALDYAVELGVLKPPAIAIAIDGEPMFTSLPTPDKLVAAMSARVKAAS